ncbi:MAG TPA: hypothetical protein VM266_11100 [Solirubrobacteraceae bacterium]|nr:hypothetical protein [Solirubrobacteraceae bacterium]
MTAAEPLPGSLRAALALVLAGLVALAVLGEAGEDAVPGPVSPERARTFPPAAADPVPYDGRSPRQPPAARERVLVELPRPPLGARDDVGSLDAAARRAYVASLEQEAAALRSALGARGVELRDVVTFTRTWHGFAATVSSRDVPRLDSLSARTRPVRRFYPALSEPVPVRPAPPPRPAPAGAPEVALLAGGAGGRAGGYDAVERDADPSPEPDPRNPRRSERSGELLARLVEARGATVRPLRVSALRPGAGLPGTEEFARTDELLDALEHAVDPDSDGDTSDRIGTVLIGVNAPYAGFADAPEAEAVEGAAALGVLVVAPAGQEGRAAGAYGTLGSPGAARAAVAVAALGGPGTPPRAEVVLGEAALPGAALLAGTPPEGELRTAGPVDADDPQALLRNGGGPLEGALAIVRAGDNPPAQVAAAAAAGAAAVVLAEPRPGRTLPALPIGRSPVPVVGLTGPSARAALAARPGTVARLVAAPPPAAVTCRERISPFSSHGPAFDGAGKPELARFGCASLEGMLVGGSAVAAAQAAGDAARLPGGAAARRDALLDGLAPGAGGPARAARVPLGALTVQRRRGLTVRFDLGTFRRGEPTGSRGTVIVPAARLDLTLEDEAGALVRRLTPPAGERGVLPGEYAYTLPRDLTAELPAGRYVVRVRARAPRQDRPTERASEPFALP